MQPFERERIKKFIDDYDEEAGILDAFIHRLESQLEDPNAPYQCDYEYIKRIEKNLNIQSGSYATMKRMIGELRTVLDELTKVN